MAVGQALVASHGAVIWVPASLAAVDAQLTSVVEEVIKVEADIANGASFLIVAIVAHGGATPAEEVPRVARIREVASWTSQNALKIDIVVAALWMIRSVVRADSALRGSKAQNALARAYFTDPCRVWVLSWRTF